MKFRVYENNSGGFVKFLGKLLEDDPYYDIEAETEEAAIAQFEHDFTCNWHAENEFVPGMSCECCGRRLEISKVFNP